MTKEVGRSYSQSPSTSCSKPTAFRLPGSFLVRFSPAKVYYHSSPCSCDSDCSYGCFCDSGCSVGWVCGISTASLWTHQAKTGHRSKALAAAKCAFCFMVQMHQLLRLFLLILIKWQVTMVFVLFWGLFGRFHAVLALRLIRWLLLEF